MKTRLMICFLAATTFVALTYSLLRPSERVSAQSSFVQFFGSNGLPINNLKCVTDITTSSGGGAWSATMPTGSAAFTTLKFYNAQALSPAGITTATATATISSASSTTISGSVYVPVNVILASPSIALSSTSTTIQYMACGV